MHHTNESGDEFRARLATALGLPEETPAEDVFRCAMEMIATWKVCKSLRGDLSKLRALANDGRKEEMRALRDRAGGLVLARLNAEERVELLRMARTAPGRSLVDLEQLLLLDSAADREGVLTLLQMTGHRTLKEALPTVREWRTERDAIEAKAKKLDRLERQALGLRLEKAGTASSLVWADRDGGVLRPGLEGLSLAELRAEVERSERTNFPGARRGKP